jgi:predicted phosphohydrolase
MDIFGKEWVGWTQKIEENWKAKITKDDLVLIAGDISWAMRIEEAIPDLEWIDSLPGTKVMIRGNHDYWWQSKSKVEKILPPSIRIIQNNAFDWNDVSIAGARLWDTPEFNFNEFVLVKEGKEPPAPSGNEDKEKIYARELGRLETSLQKLNKSAKTKICMTHYPPIGADLAPSRVSQLLEKYGVECCVFGHLHSLREGIELFGEKRGVRYLLTSCDYLSFDPIKVL